MEMTTRKIDEMGRVVLPIEMRKALALAERDSVTLSLQDNAILLRPVQTVCYLCGSDENIEEKLGHSFCAKCLSELRK